jgi:hypothetical protein
MKIAITSSLQNEGKSFQSDIVSIKMPRSGYDMHSVNPVLWPIIIRK